jgi:cytoskeletal protein CcmA (bactofilin family)
MVMSFGAIGSVKAVEFVEDGKLPAGETIDDDLFIAGEIVTVDGTVNGDLFAVGETVTINGTVNGSLMASGQTVVVNGEVAGSVYSGASALTLGGTAKVGRNLYFGGYSLKIDEGASITRDLAFGGYQAMLDGEIGRDVYAGSGALEIGGSIGGDVNAEVAGTEAGFMPFQFFVPPGVPKSVPPGLRISDRAEIDGKIAYTSTSDQSDNIEADPDGGIVFSTPQPDEFNVDTSSEIGQASYGMRVANWFLQRTRETITLLAFGALILWLLPDLFNAVVNKAVSAPLPSAGWGLLTFLLGCVIALIAAGLILALAIFFGALTLGGLGWTIAGVGFSSLGLALTIFILLISYGSKLVISFWGGKWLLEKFVPQAAETKIWPLVLGVLIYVLLRAIPVLGWIIGVIVTLIGLGAMWLVFKEWRKPALVQAEVV